MVAKAEKRRKGVSAREGLYLDALAALHKDGDNDRTRKKNYLLGLESIVQEFPNDLNARAWLAMVYRPQGAGPFPALLEIHGGAWNSGDRTSNPALAEAIAGYLSTPLTKAVVRRFADMEIFVEIQENVRGTDVFVIQSTSFPANDHLMELLIITDALRRASKRRITAVIPYFGYARQDRKGGSRTPISAKLVANLITRAGADGVMTLDLHAGQIQGFFDIPTDNL